MRFAILEIFFCYGVFAKGAGVAKLPGGERIGVSAKALRVSVGRRIKLNRNSSWKVKSPGTWYFYINHLFLK